MEGEKVLGLKRQPSNLVFFTLSRIGFAKVHEKTIISSFCESVFYKLIIKCIINREFLKLELSQLIQYSQESFMLPLTGVKS
jgi:hypothetical protein